MMDFPNETRYQKYKTSLLQDKAVVFNHCHRIVRCIIDCKLHSKDAVAAKSALEIARSLKGKAWENSPGQLRQIEGFGPVAIKKLVSSGVRSLEMLANLEPHKIEMTLSRNPPFGTNVVKMACAIPRLRVFSHQVSKVR
jgi:ATP-dependent DNA helicase HFM1/MER3